jgi:phage gp29-like protein
MLRPGVAQNWLGQSVKYYSPQMVEYVIRDAMAGDVSRQYEMFCLMEQTWPRLKGNLAKLREMVRALEWHVEPFAARGTDPTEEAVRRAGMAEDALNAMRDNFRTDLRGFSGTLDNILDAWGKGISVSEIYWERRRVGGVYQVVPRATKLVPGAYYGYPNTPGAVDELMLRREVLAGEPVAGAGKSKGWVSFPTDKFIVAVAKSSPGHPTATSLLQTLGFFWAAQNFTWEWFLNYSQLFGVPIRWATYAPTADQGTISKIEAMLAGMGSAGWAAFPQGTALELVEAVKSSAEGPQERLIAVTDKMLDILILGQTLTSDVGKVGSLAAAKVHGSTLSTRERAVAQFAEDVVNAELLGPWARLNFGTDEDLPRFCLEIEEEEDKKATADMFEVAKRIGVKIPVKFAHKSLDIPRPEDGEEVLGDSEADPAMPDAAPGAAPQLPAPEDDAVNASRASISAAGGGRTADRKLAEAVAESITGVQSEWLGGAVPWFERMISAARNAEVTDAEFERLVAGARDALPEQLGGLLNTEALAKAMEKNMGAAAVNGAVAGYLSRKAGR